MKPSQAAILSIMLGLMLLTGACIVSVEPREERTNSSVSAATPPAPTPIPTLTALPGIPVGFTFMRNLQDGMDGPDVRYLQVVLNSDADTSIAESGAGSPGQETGHFDGATRQAVIRFQEKYSREILAQFGLIKGMGFVGAATRAKLNEIVSAPQPLVVSAADAAPRFTRGCESSVDQWRGYTTPNGHTYIWTFVGGKAGDPAQPDCWAEYSSVIPASGEYDVYAWFYADPQNSTRVPFAVIRESGTEQVEVDQRASEYFTWREVKLGTWVFATSEVVRVRVTDASGEPYDGNTTMNVDTVVFVRKGEYFSGIQYLRVSSSKLAVKIDNYTPAMPIEVPLRKRVALDFSFTNTGDTAWTFQAAASLRKPDGTQVHLPLKPLFLQPGEQGSVSWTETMNQVGAWDVAFGLWREAEQFTPVGTTGWLNDYIVSKPLN